jgi:diguanylate cyclase (GGDEF)-like protein
MNGKVLIADDESGIRRLMARALQSRSFAVDATDRGDRALDMALTDEYDLIVLDVRMPGLDGFEVLRRLREGAATRLVPVILVTGLGGVDDEVAGLGFGADDYIAKPFAIEELTARAERLVQRAAEELSASPLTRLPGSPTLEKTVRDRVASREPFALLYMDIDRFKSFNDAYGFERGDRLLKRCGAIVSEGVAELAPRGGLACHVGGDDFAAVCPPEAAPELAHRIACRFDGEAPSFYAPDDRARGFVTTLDRRRREVRSPIAALRIGVATSATRPLTSFAQAAEIASELKSMLKERGGRLSRFAIDRRAS